MPAPTFTSGDEQQDERLNPGQQDADRRFGSLSDAEKRGTVDANGSGGNSGENTGANEENTGADTLRNKESEGVNTAGWKTNVTHTDKVSGKQKVKSFFKKRGGIVGILALFGIGGAGIAGILGPLAMPINLMENLSLSNDSSSTAFERRALRVFGNSTAESDSICANSTKISIKCRMGRISNSALRSLERNGVTAVFADDTTNTDKRTGYPSKNPTHYVIDGMPDPVKASDLPRVLADNPKVAAKILGTRGAFNLRVKAWSGKYIGNKLFAAFGTSKNGGIADGKGTRATAAERYSGALEKMREKIPGLNSLTGVADTVKAKVANQMDKSRKGGLGYTLAVAGCIGVKAPGYIAAGVAAVQLAQILPIVNEVILSPGSKIKASGVDVLNSATADIFMS